MVDGLFRKCKCLHNTCGDNCEKCCPQYNQKPYRPSTREKAASCEGFFLNFMTQLKTIV